VQRLEPTPNLTGREFPRWYWLKADPIARIEVALDGLTFTEPQATAAKPGAQLTGHLTPSSVIPGGQR
jgi:hypothetical protein